MRAIPNRKPDTHKGDYGKILIVAGSPGMAGAAVLAGDAAYRSGAGLVYLACPASIADILSIKQTCAVVRPFGETESAREILNHAADCDAVVIGPGLSRAPFIEAAVREVVSSLGKPFVLDADGLNAFERTPGLLARGEAPRILTPHPGEASRILGRPVKEIQADRRAAARGLARRFRAVAVLKGHRTVISDGMKIHVNDTGNPGMATGGSGDILSGMAGAFLGQKMDPFEAACRAVRLHGLAGDLAAKKVGEVSLMATDILDALPGAFLKQKRSRRS